MEALRVLNEELADPNGIEVDFETLVKEMDAAVAARLARVVSRPAQTSANLGGQSLDLSEAVLAQVGAQIESNQVVFRVDADIEEGSAFDSVHFFQLPPELSEFGSSITSAPTEDEIAEETVGGHFSALIGTDVTEDDTRARISKV
jgi:hypothetical protein